MMLKPPKAGGRLPERQRGKGGGKVEEEEEE